MPNRERRAKSTCLPERREIVLNLSRQLDQEWSADGRSDDGAAGYPILSGIHPIVLQDEKPEKGSSRPAQSPAAGRKP